MRGASPAGRPLSCLSAALMVVALIVMPSRLSAAQGSLDVSIDAEEALADLTPPVEEAATGQAESPQLAAVEPGQVVHYRMTLVNRGAATVTGAVVDNDYGDALSTIILDDDPISAAGNDDGDRFGGDSG